MKFFFGSIGCRLNQSEIEKISWQIRSEGHSVVESPDQADYIIVNTCMVTSAAAADSRKLIRHASRKGEAKIIATGCYATIDAETIASLPAVSKVVPNCEKENIPFLFSNNETESNQLVARSPFPGARKRTRTFIKIQDGCDYQCTYCITTIARGKSRSKSRAEIINDVQVAVNGGVKEIVLTGVNLGSWGKDLKVKLDFADLLLKISDRFPTLRIRLSSIEPWDINEKLIGTVESRNICPHLHIPLQSGSDLILGKMKRNTTTKEFEDLIASIKDHIPEIAITTDIIAGFPGESESEFQKSAEFINNNNFAGGHVFRFSKRPGTIANRMSGQIDPTEIRRRSKIIRGILDDARKKYLSRFLGKNISVLWQKVISNNRGYLLIGLSGNYIKSSAISKSNLDNEISTLKVQGFKDGIAEGEIVE